MNTIFRTIMAFLLCLGLTGCSKFLEEKSQDEVKPTTVTELQQLLMGEVYPAGSKYNSFISYLDLLTDDMTSNFNPDPTAPRTYQRYGAAFTWKDDMYERMEATGIDDYVIDTYEHYFRRIKGCNVVLDYLERVRGEDNDRENVRGQALTMRAYFYFMLVNLYGQPYNAPGIDRNSTPGVELILTSTVTDDSPPRASVGAVYEQIETDLLKALPLMEQYGANNSKFRVTDVFVHTLLSRMYLYMEKWDLAEKHATLALQRNSSLVRLADLAFPSWNYTPPTGVYSINSVEMIWLGYADYYEYSDFLNIPWGSPTFCVSQDLRSKYDYNPSNSSNRGDLRMRYFFAWGYEDRGYTIMTPITGDKYSYKSASGDPTKGMRVAELYLNRAEARIMQYLKNGDDALRRGALDDLNNLRSSRYDTRNVAYVPVDLSGDALLNFYRDERRRELNFEDHRWFDLRRYGMPEIRHKFQSQSGQVPVEYVLEKGSKRYVLPIRRKVLAKNPGMVPNP